MSENFDAAKGRVAEAIARSDEAVATLEEKPSDAALVSAVESLHDLELAACQLRLAVQLWHGKRVRGRP